MIQRPELRRGCRLHRAHSISFSVGLACVVSLCASVGCATSAARSCPEPLSLRLSPEEQAFVDKLPTAPKGSSTPLVGLFDDLLKERPELLRKWGDYLVTSYSSSLELEQQVMSRVQERYWAAIGKYSDALETCSRPAAGYDPTWAAALRSRFGDSLKAHAAAVRSALFLARTRVVRSCTMATRGELLDAEAGYHRAVRDKLENWNDFLTTVAGLPADQTAALIRRSETFVTILRKTSVTNMIADAQELALMEVQAGKLPPDLASALSSQTWLSKPFDLMHAQSDLNRAIGVPEGVHPDPGERGGGGEDRHDAGALR